MVESCELPGQDSEVDALMAGFDQFCVSPGKKKKKQQEKQQQKKKEEREKEKRKQKKEEKKLKPKRALTSFMAYSNQVRPEMVRVCVCGVCLLSSLPIPPG